MPTQPAHWWPLYGFGLKHLEKKPVSIRNLDSDAYIKSCARSSTIHGLPHLVDEPGFLKKFIWFCAMGLSAYGLYWELSLFLAGFLQWEAKTAINIQSPQRLYFPAVTICNNNPITYDAYNSLTKQNDSVPPAGYYSALTNPCPSCQSTSTALSTTASTATTATTAATGSASTSNTDATHSTSTTAATTTNCLLGLCNLASLSTFSFTTGTFTLFPTVTVPSLSTPGVLTSTTPSTTPSSSTSSSTQEVSLSLAEFYQLQEDISTVPYEDRQQFGHQLCDMVLACSYNGIPCSPQQNLSTWHWNAVYGNCYTFNFGYSAAQKESSSDKIWEVKRGDNDDGVQYSYQQGDLYGLYLLLNVDIERYLPTTTGVGWRVLVHNQTEMPFPEEGGVVVEPGTSTRLSVSMTYNEQLNSVSNTFYTAQYSDCLDADSFTVDTSGQGTSGNAYSTMLEVSYSKAACQKTCYQHHVMSTCKCYDMSYPNSGVAFSDISGYSSMAPCNYSTLANSSWSCLTNVKAKYSTGQLDCKCPDSCQSYGYTYTVSETKWPNPFSLVHVCPTITDIINLRINNSDSTCYGPSNIRTEFDTYNVTRVIGELSVCESLSISNWDPVRQVSKQAESIVGSRFAELYVYYKDFNYQSVTASENMALQDVIAYLGGIFGLFFGMTLLSFFEFIQFVIDMIVIGVGKLALSCKTPVPKQADPESKISSVPRSAMSPHRLSGASINKITPLSPHDGPIEWVPTSAASNPLYNSSYL